MRKGKEDDPLEVDSETVPSGPVNFRREVRRNDSRGRVIGRRKASASHRKTTKLGGIHQRANKRINW